MKTFLRYTCLLSVLCHALGAQTLTIHQIDVGQGDATLIRVSNGKAVLIDAGNTGKGKNVVVPYLRALGVTSLDYLIVSHYHADHIGGVDEVIDALSPDSIRSILDRGYNAPLPGSRAFSQYRSAAERIAAHSAAAVGQMITLSDDVALRCVAVDGSVLEYGAAALNRTDENGLSLAWVLSCTRIANDRLYRFKYFTGGDCGGPATSNPDLETPLAAIAGDVDAMKINHHGSRYSTSQIFLDSLRPEVVVISVGNRNTYGHPAQETLDRLQASTSVRFVYQTEAGSGGSTPKVKVLGAVAIAVFDSFYTVGRDTFRIAPRIPPQNRTTLTDAPHTNASAQSSINASIDSGIFSFSLTTSTFVSVRLYSLLGVDLRSLADGYFPAGTHHITLQGIGLPSGVYFVRLRTPSETLVRKAVILR
jgi:beta-lactamase superfamily II metal-dependent hydrolase